eukprot:TRINITY_DN9668_c0_g2_i7.p1 TRINITY_DN9668_c0_g2~~TRINITY_DN9668_c0_g2_i7.p1  ORF type:complete len:175 (+),score=5.76 TRINITY_DN9668_c0_g2_i7:305-829(+)
MLYLPDTGHYYDHTTGLFYDSSSGQYLRLASVAMATESATRAEGPADESTDSVLNELEAKRAKLLAELDQMAGNSSAIDAERPKPMFSFEAHSFTNPPTAVSNMVASRPTSLDQASLAQARSIALMVYYQEQAVASQLVSTAGIFITRCGIFLFRNLCDNALCGCRSFRFASKL